MNVIKIASVFAVAAKTFSLARTTVFAQEPESLADEITNEASQRFYGKM